MEKIHGFLINADTHIAAEVAFEAGLDNYRDLLGCHRITFSTLLIGGKIYDIIADDEALMKRPALISGVDKKGEPMLVGNLLVVGLADDEGEVTTLTPDDVKNIKKNLLVTIEGRSILVCEYGE